MAGGARGGSGQYVYSLGRRGFYQYFEGGYSAARSVNYHTLAIVDCFVTLRRLEREGAFKVLAMSTEPDCWAVIGGVELKPDLYVEQELAWLVGRLPAEAQRLFAVTSKEHLAQVFT
jgi:hypothetical protein